MLPCDIVWRQWAKTSPERLLAWIQHPNPLIDAGNAINAGHKVRAIWIAGEHAWAVPMLLNYGLNQPRIIIQEAAIQMLSLHLNEEGVREKLLEVAADLARDALIREAAQEALEDYKIAVAGMLSAM